MAFRKKRIKHVKVSPRCSVTIWRRHYGQAGAGTELVISTKGGPFRAKDQYAFTLPRARSIAARSVHWLRNTRAC